MFVLSTKLHSKNTQFNFTDRFRLIYAETHQKVAVTDRKLRKLTLKRFVPNFTGKTLILNTQIDLFKDKSECPNNRT